MEVCRACLSSEKNLVSFNETFIDGYNLLTNLNIKPLDGMPQCACESCSNAVHYFMSFREQCISSESRLQQTLLENIKLEPEEIKYNEEKEDIQTSSSDKRGIEDPTNNTLPKRPRGRPKKKATISKTPKKEQVRRPRKNKTILEVEKTENAIIEVEMYKKSEGLALSKQHQSYNLDFVKEEIKCEDTDEDNSVLDSLDRNINDFEVDPNICDPLVKEEDLPVHKPKIIKYKISEVKETDFPCGLCNKCFETQQSLTSHLESHKKSSECETCQEVFREWQALLAHRIDHMPRKFHNCHICLKKLFCVESLEYHYLTKHSDKNLQDIKMTCKICLKAFSNPVKLKKHISSVHGEYKYCCDHCKKTFRGKSNLKVHLRLHSDVKLYVCDTCGFSSRQAPNLKAHIWRKHTASRVYCQSCHRVYPNQETLDKHKCPQSVKICTVCGKVFKRADHLKKHMWTHSDVSKYKCSQCPAAFKTRASHAAHANRHRGERPHACPHCHKRFLERSQLVKHKRIHTGVRPYVCKVCTKAFNSNHNLKVHMKVHGEYLVVPRNKVSDNPNMAN